jgi:hypothetical protein
MIDKNYFFKFNAELYALLNSVENFRLFRNIDLYFVDPTSTKQKGNRCKVNFKIFYEFDLTSIRGELALVFAKASVAHDNMN